MEEVMMPNEITVKVELKCNGIRFKLWQFLAEMLGVHSNIARFTWWFLDPLVVNRDGTGWRPVNVIGWFEGEI